ncbi:MAG: tRNA (N(6)-L-threonylcarbamoyladenosine(37)-C(2))-methylthiotransferase MtaB [Kiritimatiellae bacterium]|jgi:threonylcarbamoyladenosine tRNA methylthiotransferase MtaB|nr:tRNA (N(6)-L-threonylcarbamoyladenosine(37)-C(2))-methylthiotransferase MtaB [Kiritimatiellia bacterium]
MKRVTFKTFGCRLNKAETALMRAQFRSFNYEIVEDFKAESDVYVIHTCTITGKAEKSCVQQARLIKRKKPDAIVILAGCAVEVNRKELLAKTGADYVFDQTEKFMMPQVIESIPMEEQGSVLPYFLSTRASVKVQDGCNFFCSYCIVPYTRGKPASRPFSEIIDEVKAFADNGYKEIVLTGANIGCYTDDGRKLVDVIKAIEKIELVKRIRISSIEVSTTEKDIIDLMADSEKLCNYLHFSLQSGDNGVLKAMRRHYTREQYIEMVEYALNKIPLVGLGADVITGLPGEDKKAFFNTYDLINSLPFSNLHVFPYSKRKGTKAADMPNQVPGNVSKERTLELIELGDKKLAEYAESWISSGREADVLVEEIDDAGNGIGWTGEYIKTKILKKQDVPLQKNTIVHGKINEFKDGKFIII